MSTLRPVTTGVLAEGFWRSQSDDKTNKHLNLGNRRHGMLGVGGSSDKATSTVAAVKSKPQRRSNEMPADYQYRLDCWAAKMASSAEMWRSYRDIGHSAKTAERRRQRLEKRAQAQ